MSKNTIHNFKLSIKNSATIKSSEHLTDAIIKELAKVSNEMSQQKDITQLWQEQLNQNASLNYSNSPTEGGANETIAGTSKRTAQSVSNTPLVSGETRENTGSESILFDNISLAKTSTFSAPIGEGVADTTGRAAISSFASANITSSIFGAESNAFNLDGGSSTQTYANVAAQQSLIVPQKLQANTSEPTIEAIKAEIKRKLNLAKDPETIEYWTRISKAFDEGKTAKDFDGQPNEALFAEMYAMLKQSNSVIESQNFNWDSVRKKMIIAIDANILKGKISKSSKKRWITIKDQLKNDSINIANLFEQYDELFLLLKEIEGLDVLPNSITITTKTKIYPNLSADNTYPKIGKKDVYVFLKKVGDENKHGRAVNRGALNIKNTEATSFVVGEKLDFFLNEVFVKESQLKMEDIDWVVYDVKNKLSLDFVNKGASFSYIFDKAGTFRVEAFGSEKTIKGNKNATSSTFIELEIIAQEIEITPPAIIYNKYTRVFAQEELFKIALKNREVKTLNPLKLYYQVEYVNNNKETKITELQELDSTGIVKLAMPNLGKYKIKVVSNDQYNLANELEIKVVKNFVKEIVKTSAGENNIYWYSKSDQKAEFKVNSFIIEPATPQEKANVKWVLYDKNGKLFIPDSPKLQFANNETGKEYLVKGETFVLYIPKVEGDYTIEAYSNSQDGIYSKAASIKKITVKHPKVTEAYWVYTDGSKKKTSGFTGEINHVKASIPGYANQPVKINFFLNDSKEAVYYHLTSTNGEGEINKQIVFDSALQKRLGIQNGKTAKIRFELEGIQNKEAYLFKKNASAYTEAVLKVTTKPQIIDAYFMYDGSRVTPFTQVPYGAKVTGVVKTLNMIGKESVLKVYKDFRYPKYSVQAKVDNEGTATINFTLDKKWQEINFMPGLMDKFYIAMVGVESKIYSENGLNAVVKNDIKSAKKEKEIIDENDPQLVWGSRVSKEFRLRVVQICKKIEKEKKVSFSPNVLMNIMAFETINSFSPTAGTFKNDPNDDNKGGYVGLIQFGKDAAVDLKVKRSALLRMTALEQLDYVEKWFLLKTKDQLKTATDIYLSVNFPTKSGIGHLDKEFIYGDPQPYYRANKPFLREADEINKKGDKVGKDGGKTYVWEVREALEENRKSGEYARNIWRHPLDRMELRGWYSTWRLNDSKFGYTPTRDSGKHEGLDLYAPVGTPVHACVDGLIVFNGTAGGYGNTVVLKGYYESKLYFFAYSHLREKSKFIADKSWVKAGEIIAYTGQSGNAKNLSQEKTHLHFEVRPLKEWGDDSKEFRGRVDPIKEIKDLFVDLNPDKEKQI